jgi:hypothetical protein
MVDETEYLTGNLITSARARDLTFWKIRCEKQLQEFEFESMMIRKYALCSFYKKARDMTIEELNERLWRLQEILIPWYKNEIDTAGGILYRNHQARELLQNSMKPYESINFKFDTLIQKELF